MQFHPSNHDPTSDALLVCRNARWVAVLLAACFWGFMVFLAFERAPVWLLGLWGMICIPVTAILWSDWIAKGRPENWMIAVHRDGVWLNLRDVAFRSAPQGQSVVFLPYQELHGVREHVHKYRTRDSDGGDTHHKDTYVELLTDSNITNQVAGVLSEERLIELPSKSYFWGGIEVRAGRIRYQPVTVPTPGVLRVAASKRNYGMRPGPRRVVEVLSEFIQPVESIRRNDGNLRNMDDADFEATVAEFARRGDVFAAVKLLVDRRGMSLTDARSYVQSLQDDATNSLTTAEREEDNGQ
ncbi:MAG: hypothetical protein KDA60_04920 [Planctomycetales bacterium]|nr:hypothetical protein [Planctomycetales bacterium]